MIKNKRQLIITKSQLNKLEEALHRSMKNKSAISPRIYNAMISGLKSQIQELKKEIIEYKNLLGSSCFIIHKLNELPLGLIRARIARNLTQEELAKKVCLKPQQIQRYEKNNYQGVKLERIIQIWEALEVDFKQDITIVKSFLRRAA